MLGSSVRRVWGTAQLGHSTAWHSPATTRLVRAHAAQGQYLLVDTPVSNHSARVRFLVAKKQLGDVVKYVPPSHFGGLTSPEYLKMNAEGKFPTLVLPDGSALPESEVIVQYLLDKYKGVGPDLVATTPEARAIGALITRIHDLYIAPVQGCMYRPMPSAEARAQGIRQLAKELDVIEAKMVGGPFITGPHITTADGALFPTMVFLEQILPKHFGWSDVFAGRPKLRAWWSAVRGDPEASKVIAEIEGGLQAWEKEGRWAQRGIDQQVADNPNLGWQG